MRPVARHTLLGSACILLAGVTAGASSGGAQPERLDPGISDINSLQTSLRALPPVIRHDTAFEHVYQSPLDPNQRYRVAGGIYAVFSSSEYISTPYGGVPVYPAGVQFHIGPPIGFDGSPIDPATAAIMRETSPHFDLRSLDQLGTEHLAPGPNQIDRRDREIIRMPPPIPTISSEAVRQDRLRKITAKALGKEGLGG